MLDEALPQFTRGIHPVSICGQEDAAGAHAVPLRIVHAWWSDTVLHVRLDRGDQAAADANDHRVSGAEMLYGAIEDVAHAGSHRRVLHADAIDAGVTGRPGV